MAKPGQPHYSPAEIDAIAGWLREGFSAAAIAAKLWETSRRSVSRNAVIGIVHRDLRLRAIGFARSSGVRYTAAERAERRAARTREKAETPAGKAGRPAVARLAQKPALERRANRLPGLVDAPRAYDDASRRLPLADLGWRDCRFAVNDAAEGETHLFCGLPTDGGSYCAHHALRCGAGYATAGGPFRHNGWRRAA